VGDRTNDSNQRWLCDYLVPPAAARRRNRRTFSDVSRPNPLLSGSSALRSGN
jgi:hypothetical protein